MCVDTERLETNANAAVMTDLYDSEFTPRRRTENEKEKVGGYKSSGLLTEPDNS